jgi:hypothetical protein
MREKNILYVMDRFVLSTPEDKKQEIKAGLLTYASPYFEPSHTAPNSQNLLQIRNEYSGLLISSTFTVAGTAPDFHRIPY